MRHAHVRAALPRLRRHAFILSGDRALADESVVECLKAYREDPQRVRPEAVNIDLFRLFHDTAALGIAARAANRVVATAEAVPAGMGAALPDEPSRPVAPPRAVPPPGRGSGVAGTDVLGRFQALPPGHRQVLTLVSVEGFTVEECAHVLGLSAQRVGTLLADARSRLAAL